MSSDHDNPTGESCPACPSFRAVGLVLAAIWIVALLLLYYTATPRPPEPKPEAADAAAAAAPSLSSLCGRQFGEASARVEVTALLPVSGGCQDALGLFLVKVAEKVPEKVSVRVYDMKSDDAAAIMQAQNIRCACVIVNGRTRFDLGPEDGKRLLEGPMDPADVRTVLLSELKTVYGEPVPELPAAPVVILPKPNATAPAPELPH